MGKVIFWLLVIFAVLFALRLYNSAKSKREAAARDNAARAARDRTGQPMVRCVSCGVYLPQAEAMPVPQGFRCREGNCVPQR
jgi:hypothetical protein